MNDSRFPIYMVLSLLVIMTLYFSTFVVHQTETVLRLRLGEIVDTDYGPGLHFMIPIIDWVKKYDRRIRTMDSRPERFQTKEQKDVIVDFYAKWRVSKVSQYYRSTKGSEATTEQLLLDRIDAGLRDEFGKRTIQEVVSGEREQIMELLTKEMNLKANEVGVEIVDIRVKRIDLPPEVSESVYERMRAERERVAKDLRALGTEAAEKVRADADRQRTVILADAYKQAEELRGEGDAKATTIYAAAYQQNPEFYGFYRSLNAYTAVFKSENDTLVLEPNSDFFQFFKTYKDKNVIPH